MDRTVYKEELFVSYHQTMTRAWKLAQEKLNGKEMYCLQVAVHHHSEDGVYSSLTRWPEIAELWRRGFEISELAATRYGGKVVIHG